MRGKASRPRPHSNLRFELKNYRNAHQLTQEDLAELLAIESRTLRRWESGETILTDVHELSRIAECLGIPHENLGITAPAMLHSEEIHTGIDRVWDLIQTGLIRESRTLAESMVRRVSQPSLTGDKKDLRLLVDLYHAAAHATSLNVRTEEVEQAIYYYKQMEYYAQLLGDTSLLNTALTYLGDMYRRKGDIARALAYLETARDMPDVDIAASGNNMQLLARIYIRAKRVQEFDSAIKCSEELAHELKQINPATQYHLAHVYEEYAKSYVALGQTQKALDYVELAEKHSPQTKSVEMLLKVARAEALIYSGDIRNGEMLAVEAAIYTREHGHYRRLERIYALKKYINQQILNFGSAERALSDALEGPMES